jgi:hypothetical protein
MARRTSNGMILVHVILTLCTGGLWLIVPIIKFLTSNSR